MARFTKDEVEVGCWRVEGDGDRARGEGEIEREMGSKETGRREMAARGEGIEGEGSRAPWV